MTAAADERLIRASPCRGIRLPRVDRTEQAFLSREQVTARVDAAPEHYQALIAVAYLTGLRWSELAGLRVRRIDTLRRRLQVVEVAKESPAG